MVHHVYRYQFTKENGYHATYHSGEMAYCYGNLSRQGKDFAYNEEDYKLEKTMLSYWSNFAKNGDPNGEGLPTWNPYQSSTDKVMELGTNVGPIDDLYQGVYAILDSYIDYIIVNPTQIEE